MKVSIKILGTGCSKCNMLADLVAEVIKENGFNADLQKIGDIEQILAYRVITTPGLVINEKVVSFGRVPSKEEIRGLIENSNNG